MYCNSHFSASQLLFPTNNYITSSKTCASVSMRVADKIKQNCLREVLGIETMETGSVFCSIFFVSNSHNFKPIASLSLSDEF